MAKKPFDIMSVMNPQSIMGGEHTASEFVVEMLPLEEIEPNEDNFYNTENIEALAADILQNGLMHNIKVCSRGENGLYKLISGERRYRAFALLKEQGNEKFDTIPATVDAETNPLFVKLKLISANASARVLSDYEKTEQAVQIKEIVKQLKQQGVELPGRAREIAAQALGVSPAQVGRAEKIVRDLVPEVKEKFAAGEIGVTEAYDVATLPAEQQVQAVEENKAKVHEPKPSFLTQADIDAVLLRGGSYMGAKARLARLYAERPTDKTAVDALKQEFGQGGNSFTYASGERGFVDYTTKGLVFTQWGIENKITISWAMAHKRVLELIENGVFVVTPEDADEENEEPAQEQSEAEKTQAAPLPEQTPKAPTKPPYIGTAVRIIPWADGFDDELTSAALCLEHWNEMASHKPEFEFIKGLILREAAMRKKRAE